MLNKQAILAARGRLAALGALVGGLGWRRSIRAIRHWRMAWGVALLTALAAALDGALWLRARFVASAPPGQASAGNMLARVNPAWLPSIGLLILLVNAVLGLAWRRRDESLPGLLAAVTVLVELLLAGGVARLAG